MTFPAVRYDTGYLVKIAFHEAVVAFAVIEVAEVVNIRLLGENEHITLTMKKIYAESLYLDDDATLDDLREAVTTLEDTARAIRRLLGGAHPVTGGIEAVLVNARAVLADRETPSASA